MPRLDIETRRSQLIESAIRIALRDGLDNTTIRRIATEAGVSLGTVHYCFDSKRALLEAVVESLVARELPPPEIDALDNIDPVEAVRQAFRYYWQTSGAQTEYQRLFYEIVAYLVRQEDPGPELAHRLFVRNFGIVERFLEVFARRWEVQYDIPREVLARLIVAMTDGVALAWLTDGDGEGALAVLDAFAVMVTTGVQRVA